MRNQSLHLCFDYRTPIIPISWIPVQIPWCEDWIFLTKTKIQSPHHHICAGIHNIGISRMLQLLRRCKDHIGSHPPSVHWCRVSPNFRTMFPWAGTSPCTSVLKLYFILYPFQWSRWGFGGVRTGSFFVKTKIQSLHHHICTGIIETGIKLNIFLIKRCKDHIGGHPPSVSMYRVNPYFENDVLRAPNQSLHLRIDDRTPLVFISGLPVSIWRCEDWIFITN